jgi:hypothetical protein
MDQHMETTIGQLNSFKWVFEHDIINYIEEHFDEIERDMNTRNGTPRKRCSNTDTKTRKKREELSLSACKCIKKEDVQIIVNFDL